MGVHLNAQLIEYRHGILVHFLFVNGYAAYLGIAAQPYVIHNAALEGLVQLLMHHGYAVVQGLLAVFKVYLLAVKVDIPLVFAVNAKEALHQGRLACAVFAHEGMNRTGFDFEINVVQRLYAGKRFGDPYHFKQSVLLHAAFPPLQS